MARYDKTKIRMDLARHGYVNTQHCRACANHYRRRLYRQQRDHKIRSDDPLFPFIENLYADLRRKRKENNDVRTSRVWNVEAVLKLELIRILDWIEDQLLAKIKN